MNYVYLLGLSFTLLIFLLIILPINLKAKVSYDAIKNKGIVQLKIFKLTLLYYDLVIQKGFIELKSTKSGKTVLVPIILDDGDFQEIDLVIILLKKIYIQQGTIYINFGAKNQAFITAMSVGVAKVLTSVLGALIKSKKSESKIKNKIYASFNKDQLKVSFKASIKISILQAVIAFIQSRVRRIKNNKEIMQHE